MQKIKLLVFSNEKNSSNTNLIKINQFYDNFLIQKKCWIFPPQSNDSKKILIK